MPVAELTARQRQILEYIDFYWGENWTSPTVREIGRAVGLRSPDSVYLQLESLTRKGVLERKKLSSRRVLYRRASESGGAEGGL